MEDSETSGWAPSSRRRVRRWSLAAAWIGWLAAAAGPANGWPPRNTFPHTVAVVLACGVDDDSKTRDCRLVSDRLPSRQEAEVISDVAARPEFLPGAKPGSNVVTIIRRDPGARDKPLPPAEVGPPEHPRLIEDADWDAMPTKELADYYPDRAQRMSLSGKAIAACSVTAEGLLVGCWISGVEPPGEAFELATLMLTTILKMKPLTRSGAPVDGGVYMLVSHFQVSGYRAVVRLTTPGAP